MIQEYRDPGFFDDFQWDSVENLLYFLLEQQILDGGIMKIVWP